MRLFLGLVLFVTGAFPVLADAACESEFRRLMQQGNAGFPYAATIRTEFAGKVTEVSTTVVGAAHSMTLSDEHGLRSINKGNRIWMSTDKGKSWKLAHTLPKDTVDKASAMLTRQASIATDITCTDGTEVGGKKYRLVQGKFTTDKTNFPALQKFFMSQAPAKHGR